MSVSTATAPQNPKSVDDLPQLVTESGATLYRWPGGWRYVPPPTLCQKCKQPATGLLSWHDKMGLLYDFAGCNRCASAKRYEVESSRFTVRAYRFAVPEEASQPEDQPKEDNHA